MTTLTDRVVEYQRTGCGFEDLRNSILLRAYRFPVPSRGFDDDDRSEFLLFFYPMVQRVLERYRPSGSPFEAYLNTYFRYQLKSYLRSRAQKRLRTQMGWTYNTEVKLHAAASVDFEQHKGPDLPTYGAGLCRERPKSKSQVGRRCSLRDTGHMPTSNTRLTHGEAQRLLLAALKSCDRLEDTTIRRFATAVGFDEDWIIDTSTTLRCLCAGQRLRRELLRNRRDHAWFAAECAREEIRTFASESRRKLLTERALRLDQTARRARAELRHAGRGPTNEQIAAVVGIRKGTIDSSIFRVRREASQESLRRRLEASAFDAYDVPHAAALSYQQPAQTT